MSDSGKAETVALTRQTEKDVELAANEVAPAIAKPPYCALAPARKRFILSIVTVAGFFGPLAGNIYLPALPILQQVFHVSTTAINATVSAFMVVFAFAVRWPCGVTVTFLTADNEKPLFWTGFADYKGRRPLYIISLGVYIVSNVLMAAVPANFGALVFLRIMQAFGSAAVVSLGAGTVADVRAIYPT